MSKPIETLEAFNGERGVPSVSESTSSGVQRGLIFVVLVLVVLMAAGAGYWKYQQQKKRNEEAAKQRALVTSSIPTRTFGDPPAPAISPVASAPAMPAPGRGAAAQPPMPNMSLEPPPPMLDKSRASLMIVGGSGLGESSDATPGQPGQPGQSGGLLQASGGGSGALASLLSSTNTPKKLAGHLGNRNFILAKGSFIDCALQTKLDSTVPGMTACVVTRNIYSDNGKVLLVERGSTITGEYQSNMKQGMARIFVLWSRIKTPNGITINLDSPGTDPLGGGGLPGYIDTHFWERFGGALMLSLVNDVGNYAAQRTSNNNTNINLGSTNDAVQNMAAEALKNTINIPPTLYKNQGEQINVYVARDLDFSAVYDVSIEE